MARVATLNEHMRTAHRDVLAAGGGGASMTAGIAPGHTGVQGGPAGVQGGYAGVQRGPTGVPGGLAGVQGGHARVPGGPVSGAADGGGGYRTS